MRVKMIKVRVLLTFVFISVFIVLFLLLICKKIIKINFISISMLHEIF